MAELIDIEQTGHARIIRLNRPEKKNALNEALAWGIVDGRFRDYLAQISSWSPFSIRMTKRGMHQAVRAVDLKAQVRLELANIRRCFETEDAREARRAFFEKRPPRFSGH